jgi:DNA-binding transcriptional regulator LsrR (DeoR family)
MLTDARESGIIDIRIQRPLHFDSELGRLMKEKFGLKDVFVVITNHRVGERLTRTLGNAGAQMLARHLSSHMILGLAWGTSISATVDAFEVSEAIPVNVVQLVGAMGAHNVVYDGHDLVARLTVKLDGEAFYINAPYLCENSEMAKLLLKTKSIRETINMGKKTDVALLGIGTTSSDYSSFYLAGYVTNHELARLRKSGAVGDVCGLHFNLRGQPVCDDFCSRLVSIQRQDLLSIPVRLGVAGGEGKIEAILGALRIKYVNVLVIDNLTAKMVLELAKQK